MNFNCRLRPFFCSCTLLSFTIVYCQAPYYPDSLWQFKKPAEVRMDALRLDSAVNFAVKNDSKTNYNLKIADMEAYGSEPNYRILGPMKDRGGPAGMIIRHGFIVAEWGDVKRVDMTFSATKSYLSTVAGLAVDNGLIKNVDDLVNEYVTDGTYEGMHNSKVTWRHLLTQSSDWSGCLFDICDWADRPVPADGGIDEWKNRKLFDPGTHFKYNDVRVNLLAYSLLQVWRKPLPVVLKERIMDPIGASTTWRWYGYENSFVNIDGVMTQSVSGGGHFGGGLFISTMDHARFGLLFLRKGRWKNIQLISENWVKAVQQPSAANKSYGFMWWLNADLRYKTVPQNIYMAEGFGGNFVIIDNEDDLVMVARWLEPSKVGEFIRLVIDAVER
ncbi:MAG TPA: serine hydrolase [Puia sp.]|nr:serine hydrolase [Puia sp.]